MVEDAPMMITRTQLWITLGLFSLTALGSLYDLLLVPDPRYRRPITMLLAISLAWVAGCSWALWKRKLQRRGWGEGKGRCPLGRCRASRLRD
jgi:hypothetical protein